MTNRTAIVKIALENYRNKLTFALKFTPQNDQEKYEQDVERLQKEINSISLMLIEISQDDTLNLERTVMTKKEKREIIIATANMLIGYEGTYTCPTMNRAVKHPADHDYCGLAKEFCEFFGYKPNNAFFSDPDQSSYQDNQDRLLALAVFLELGDKI